MSNNGAQQFQFQIRLVNEPEKEKEKEKKPEVLKLNEPSHEVMVDENGDLDIVPEDVLESIDFPPEFAEFLGDAVRQLREIHGIPEEEDIPQELLNSLAEQLLRISEESPSSEMLAGGIETEPENVTGGGCCNALRKSGKNRIHRRGSRESYAGRKRQSRFREFPNRSAVWLQGGELAELACFRTPDFGEQARRREQCACSNFRPVSEEGFDGRS